MGEIEREKTILKRRERESLEERESNERKREREGENYNTPKMCIK